MFKIRKIPKWSEASIEDKLHRLRYMNNSSLPFLILLIFMMFTSSINLFFFDAIIQHFDISIKDVDPKIIDEAFKFFFFGVVIIIILFFIEYIQKNYEIKLEVQENGRTRNKG